MMHQAFLTVDLGFGDAGKGSLVDYLTRIHGAHTVVRYNGGAQAAHRVVTSGPQPQEHVFSQFGSGTLAGAATHLSRFMLLDPPALLAEAQALRKLGVTDVLRRTTIDERALVITPFARAVNRLKELARGPARHGSCGMGIGETAADALIYGERVLRAGDLADEPTLRRKLEYARAVNLAKVETLRPRLPDNEAAAQELDLLLDQSWSDWLIDTYRDVAAQTQIVTGTHLHTLLRKPGCVVFEGAQGVLLDEWRGFHPHTTWSTTTLANAELLLHEAGYNGDVTRIGITRAYATRHGAGPLVTEDAALSSALPDARNGLHAWQGGFRAGWLDLVLLRYARAIAGQLDSLAVTCLDRLNGLERLLVCRHYHCDGQLVTRLEPAPTTYADQALLDYQASLAGRLARCRPLLEPVANPAALLELLANELDLPVRIVSAGPTAADKTCR